MAFSEYRPEHPADRRQGSHVKRADLGLLQEWGNRVMAVIGEIRKSSERQPKGFKANRVMSVK